MVSEAWRKFDDEIARWRDAGRPVEFWWRDDDAVRPAPELARLLELAAQTRFDALVTDMRAMRGWFENA